MSLREIALKKIYDNISSDVPRDFLIPALENSSLYDRATGFFSSAALAKIADGIVPFVRKGGKIRIVTSPKLEPHDIETIAEGYEKRALDAILREIKPPESENEAARLDFLANLIAQNVLDIKIAFSKAKAGIFHVKFGIFRDDDGNAVSFSGSMNETEAGFCENYEEFGVFPSWTGDSERCKEYMARFENIWQGAAEGVVTKDFPEAKEKIVAEYEKSDIDLRHFENPAWEWRGQKDGGLSVGIVLRDYQREAIEKWSAAGFRGIFDMATGTGKTKTALAGIARLSSENRRVACIICAPYQHLASQWADEAANFGFDPILAFSDSPQSDWKDRLSRACFKHCRKSDEKQFFCLVTTNDTFAGDFVQSKIADLKDDVLLVADEAHNFGAKRLRGLLDGGKFKWRLALSATVERCRDEEGTKSIFDFFGEKCIEYGLKRAIDDGFLVPYKYHPIVVSLNDEERDEYRKLTEKIRKSAKSDDGEMSEACKMLCIARSRIVAGAAEKIDALVKTFADFTNKRGILIYCGTSRFAGGGYVEGGDGDEGRQIDAVIKALGKYKMCLHRFTSENDAEERDGIKKRFASGELQAIVAIKCLDEGVDIPSIETAFILASSTNPKEWVQRRGRVLRKSEGKKCAEIFDFVTLPFPRDVCGWKSAGENEAFSALARNEVARMREFAALSQNGWECEGLISEIERQFGLHATSK